MTSLKKYQVLVTEQYGVWYEVHADTKEEAKDNYSEGVKISEKLVDSQVEEVEEA